VRVDPDLLRAFAGHVDAAGDVVGGTGLGSTASTGADGLPGSTTQWSATLVGEHIGGLVGNISTELGKIGAAVRGAGDTYEAQDDVLAGTFSHVFK
jgi:hypothetical protein